MSRLKKHANVPSLLGSDPLSTRLKHQNPYGQEPWKPGEIPSMRTGSRNPVYGSVDDKPQPYGEMLAVQKPENFGKGYSPIGIVDVEGKETKTKQSGAAHGGRGKI
jgi:hypothetical protein